MKNGRFNAVRCVYVIKFQVVIAFVASCRRDLGTLWQELRFFLYANKLYESFKCVVSFA